jgi:DNA-binding transcriptional LysR family regulator
MNIRSLRLFRQIILSGSLAQAASTLNMSPSAASRQLSLLEAEVGLTLFLREKRQLELTAEGGLFYRQIAHVLSGLEEIPSIANEVRQRSHERLSLVTAAPIALGLVSPALGRLQSKGEKYDCTLNVENRFDIESKVAARSYNLGIISTPVENAIVDLVIEPILESRLLAVVPAGHPLARLDEVPVDTLADEKLVVLRSGQRWRNRLDDLLAATGRLPQVAVETSSTVVAMQLVAEGLGVALADRICGHPVTGNPVVFRPIAPAVWVSYASIHGHGPRSALAGRFLEAIDETVEAMRASDPEIAATLRPV